MAIRFRDSAEIEYIVLSHVERGGDRAEAAYFFEPEDVDRALADLDRLHAELESETVRPHDE